MKQAEKTRDSNIELLRIITMFLIVAHHYVCNTELYAVDGPIYANPLSWRSMFLLIFGAWGKVCINCFVMITGYFMCKSNITLRKYLKLAFEVLFYSVVISSVFWISGYDPFSIMKLVKSVLIVRIITDDFAPAFLMFYLFIPFLNILIRSLNQRQHIHLILLCLLLYVFFGTFRPFFYVEKNYVTWFMVVYVIASYIRLYPSEAYSKTSLWGRLLAVCIFLDVASIVACAWASQRFNINIVYGFMIDANSTLPLATGICAFLFFKSLRLGKHPFINTVAQSTFGVLLIHANSETMRQWLWKDLLDNAGHYGSPFMPLHAFGSVIGVFAVCILIDYCRIHVVEKPFFHLIDKHLDGLMNAVKNLDAKLCRRLGIHEQTS